MEDVVTCLPAVAPFRAPPRSPDDRHVEVACVYPVPASVQDRSAQRGVDPPLSPIPRHFRIDRNRYDGQQIRRAVAPTGLDRTCLRVFLPVQ